MDTILPSELPYVIGSLVVVIAIFWLIDRAADRGLLSYRSRSRPVFFIIAGLLAGAACVLEIIGRRWTGVAIYGCGFAYYAFMTWRSWQRT